MPNVYFARFRKTIFLSSTAFTLAALCFPQASAARQNTVQDVSDSVQVGYGLQKKQQTTGASQTISARQFNQGLVVSPQQLISGQIAGVQITGLSGAPGADFLVQQYRNATLAGRNEPLVVLDGVLLESEAEEELVSALALLNPQDLASVTFLKDAAATGMYGSRGVNGVLFLTSKRGSENRKLQVDFRSQVALSTLPKKVDVLSAEEFRQVVTQRGTQEQKSRIGSANTDWQDVVYENAVSHDQHLSLGGTIGFLPYRVAVGYLHQNGILTNSYFKRKSAALTLNPSFFEDHLKLDVSLKGIKGETRSPHQRLINAVVNFNPTQPVYGSNGEYFEWRDGAGKPEAFAPLNPLGLLERSTSGVDSERKFGNAHLAYRLHFLPALTAHINLGYNHQTADGRDNNYTYAIPPGSSINVAEFGHTRKNRQTEFYLTYAAPLEKLKSQVDLTAGYSAQKITDKFFLNSVSEPGGNLGSGYFYETNDAYKAFFGSLQYGFKGRYFLTASARGDQSPLFAEQNRDFTSKALGLGWLLSEEEFLKNQPVLSYLKLRTSYGVQGNTPLLPSFNPFNTGTNSSAYPNPDLTWEKTTSFNLGADVGLWGTRINASLDLFLKKTDDLLSYRTFPNTNNGFSYVLANGGEAQTKGGEVSLQYLALDSEKTKWVLALNASYAKNKLVSGPMGAYGARTFLLAFSNPRYVNTPGHELDAYSVYVQKYNNGSPVEGQYEDVNNNGTFGPEDQRIYHSARPKSLLGFTSQATYNQWSLGFMVRAQLGAYAYNRHAAETGFHNSFRNSSGLQNLSSSVLETNFNFQQPFSDYYLENASFLRMEYISVGYDFGKILQDKAQLNLTATVQNAFVLTGYSGQDPEVAYGNGTVQYPRARTFSLTLEVSL
ncbi:SusC/RagA family TonB-linked outer membrane protein [Rufibacter hautae]|uniref:SusC/RagA family TonB-linked outer membrane protein n=1 Tax=Rufibacter hautae TaxID=2595005 RepID=A0A5B6T9F3_9BACT|nr:SusC/RagA family TonB-linked outer membrane protein [Rufibacter hautae]KAA3436826.1 SusC/RagA family TonB-linked outer membrane protein [Rufibacter hautae]